MDQRVWSKGSPNYVGYLDRLMANMAELGVTDDDLVLITGDLVHDMSKTHLAANFGWLDSLPGHKVFCRGNHDHQVDAGFLAMIPGLLSRSTFISEGSFALVGPYLIGCYSDHRNSWGDGQGNQPAFSNVEAEVLEMAAYFVQWARIHKKIPIMISHYPATAEQATKIGQLGIKAYLSGHVHCTNNRVPGGTDWTWYDKSARQTDDKVIEGCYFSTGTTDVVLNRTGRVIKEWTGRMVLEDKKPGQQKKPFKAPENPAAEMVILAGLPASGKSTFSRRYAEKGYVRISQDDMGSKGAAMLACERALAQGKSVVVDRMNFSVNQRKPWVDMARKYRVQSLTCIDFSLVPVDTCVARILARQEHPTLGNQVPPDRREAVVRRVAQEWEEPETKEGFKVILRVRESDFSP
jgi:predicted phosphohydrolase/predicted kinase